MLNNSVYYISNQYYILFEKYITKSTMFNMTAAIKKDAEKSEQEDKIKKVIKKINTFKGKEFNVGDMFLPEDLIEAYAYRIEAIVDNAIGITGAETGINFGNEVKWVTKAFIKELEQNKYRIVKRGSKIKEKQN